MNAHTYNAPTISAGTIARTACLLLALTNQLLSACGKPVLPIESATVEQLVTAGITTVAALVSWWKNNSFTAAAIEADAYKDSLKAEVPSFEVGDSVRVHVKIKEGDRERIQVFEGTIIARNGSGIAETFTVRRVSYGVGVERVFPVHSPNVVKVETTRNGRVRRSKLYYLRDRVGKAAKVKEQVR